MKVRVASFASLAPSSALRVVATDAVGTKHAIAVVRIEDALYAIGDVCSHAEVSLSDGTVWDDECELECPKHGSAFSLTTGAPQSFPATHAVPVYDIEREGDDVMVTLT
jgi:3-phenylpropionate/trans-cinnamate dioxygenase ferredoxin component